MRISRLFDFDNDITDEMLEEVEIPEETPEEKAAKIKRLLALAKERMQEKEEIDKQKQALIAQEPNYDDYTKKAIDNFVERLTTLYPDILPKDEIYARIHANLKSSIEFKNFLEIGKPLSSGLFLPKEHRMLISLDRKDEDLEATLFHEFCHVLVDENPYDNEKEFMHRDYEDSNFITETIITLMEEDCYKKILGGKNRRANGYIVEYAEQLRAILGNEIIYSFIRRFKYVDDLICKCDEIGDMYSDLPYNLIGNIDPIWYKLNYPKSTGTDKSEIAYQNASIELVFALMLDNYFDNTELTDEEKLEKIEQLFKHQQDPNFKVYREIIEKHIKNKELLEENRFVNYLYRANLENYEHLQLSKEDSIKELVFQIFTTNQDSLRQKYKKYAVKEMFGINEYALRKDDLFPLPKYDIEKFITYHKSKETFMALFSIYQSAAELYDNGIDLEVAEMYNCVLDEKIDESDLVVEEGYGASELERINSINDKIKMTKIVSKTGKEYYLSYALYPELFEKKSINDLVIETNDKLNRATNDDEREFYKTVLKQQQEMLQAGITEVYENNTDDNEYYRCVYELNGKVYHTDIHRAGELYNKTEVFQLQKMKTLSPMLSQNIKEDTKLISSKND